ncbi:hypothetical protein RHGRI_013738 [Rhododendron griersonianum]|uniref:Uncharacterized protein n=1 Tax=Rhododendron griersonianum TaxID=479676 RepID=A0AAV6K703_9ERIC|nr:hypothetical protein RHGRI_013738 [Rhododendron griersonianum]
MVIVVPAELVKSHSNIFFLMSLLISCVAELDGQEYVWGMPSTMGDALEWFSIHEKGKALGELVSSVPWQLQCMVCEMRRMVKFSKGKLLSMIRSSSELPLKSGNFLAGRNLNHSLKNKALCDSWGLAERILKHV